MTKHEARIVVLEDALIQAQHTVQFLHDCLTKTAGQGKSYEQPDIQEAFPNLGACGGWQYAYPEHTLRRLEEWQKLVPVPAEKCFHSHKQEGCNACDESWQQRARLHEATRILGQ
jgi:hypothetical protein